MAGMYRPRHPERTVLYRVLFHHFDRFLSEYESRFEKEYGFLRPIVKEVVERYLDCGNPRCGFARIRCPDCAEERLVMFSCRTRGFCPSCHAKRLEEWGEWVRETLLLDVPHRQVVFTIPKMLRVFFKFKRKLLGELCRCAEQETMDYLEFIARVTSHIPDKGQVMVRYYGLYANAHRGKVKKAGLSPSALRLIEEDLKRIPSKGWAAMIRKVFEVNPMVCPKCGGLMKVVAFITEYAVVDRIIDHLKLTFTAAKPPPSHVLTEVALTAAEESGEHF